MPTLLRLMDLMALLKLNRFHWHFADDEAFRLEIDTAPPSGAKPPSAAKAAPSRRLWRRHPVRRHLQQTGRRHLIAHAKALNIEILPEIEIPAHAFALNAAIPGLRDPGDNGAEISIQGYPVNVINPAMPRPGTSSTP